MSARSQLSKLRAELDQKITYGLKKDALKFARFALRQAKDKGLTGETEYFRGQVQMLRKNYVTAIEHFDRAIGYDPHDGAAYNDRALCMVELGIIDEAFSYFDKGIAVEPDYATVYHNKGWLLNNIGRHSEAIEYFRRALELEPERAVTFDNLADALLNLGNHKGATEAWEKVLKLLKPGSCVGIRRQIISQINKVKTKLKKD
ncbi:MAG: tetratricopeptide repeat protein [Candidatus Omnitrophica bacterium]|nr:tetratricopeptide repeat protein [Candidatus Omnitrophota bacterium]